MVSLVNNFRNLYCNCARQIKDTHNIGTQGNNVEPQYISEAIQIPTPNPYIFMFLMITHIQKHWQGSLPGRA